MIRCLAIDDEPLALEQLKKYISMIPFLELSGACNDAFEAMSIIAHEKIDVIFVDINMPDLSGMDFVRSLIDAPLVVFTTAYSKYAVDAYKVDAVDYLLKPFSFEDFNRAVCKVMKQIEMRNITTTEKLSSDSIFVKSDYKILKIEIMDIEYIESMSEYLKIFVTGDKKPIITLLSMRKIESYLPDDTFMRIHRSYIVNLNRIKEINKLRVILDKDTYLPIGDNYKDKFYEYVNRKFICK
jgi:DNA-binding LytR/AlgR family response regulator